jgi:hypothetical protein
MMAGPRTAGRNQTPAMIARSGGNAVNEVVFHSWSQP